MKTFFTILMAFLPIAPAVADVPVSSTSSGSVPAVVQVQIDPARLSIATRIAGRLLPDGTYEKMMGGSMNQLMASVTDSTMDLPIRSLAGISGLDAAKLKQLGPGTLRQLTAILDPAYQQRMRIILPVMMSEMGRFFTQFEPSLREGIAEAYAARFNEAQLKEIDAFYGTPTGSLVAAQSMTIMADPPVMSRMQAMMPKMMQAMPDIMKRAMEATTQLPKPRKYDELSPAEKAQIGQLLGIDPAKVK